MTGGERTRPSIDRILRERQNLIKQWKQMRAEHPDLTQNVHFHANRGGQFEGLTTQRDVIVDRHGWANWAPGGGPGARIDMASNQALGLPASTNRYAIAHELGHANERKLNAHQVHVYNKWRGLGLPARGHRDYYGMETGYTAHPVPGETPTNELYAADFAGALGRKWPDGKQLFGQTRKYMQRLGILPGGKHFGR